MFVILTSKPGQYRTVPSADIELIEAWDYQFYGRLQAQFVIGKLLRETKVQVIEEDASGTVNAVPSKFLERFDTLAQAHAELQHLCNFGSLDAQLISVPLPQATASA